jgi:hypothetical protein
MLSLRYTIDGKKYDISREEIIRAMRQFDRKFSKARPTRGRKFFVWFSGKPYPPKDILSLACQIPKGIFSGGESTNQIFRDLEFLVSKGKLPKRLPDTNTPLSTVETLRKRLFAQKWSRFEHRDLDFLKGSTGKYPGVYLLAYSDQPLQGKPVDVHDVFYVGSSCTGLNARLNQFFDGTTRNCCHSAAQRFYRRWRRRVCPGHSFYVAAIAVPCETRKELRVEKDLRKMGLVAELEYVALAHIKTRTRFEPLLNRK